MAIAWIYREDYARAGIRMLPTVDPKGDATFRQIVCTSAILVWVSALPSLLGMAGMRYFFGALVLGMLLLQVGLWANRSAHQRPRQVAHARHGGAHPAAADLDDRRQADASDRPPDTARFSSLLGMMRRLHDRVYPPR